MKDLRLEKLAEVLVNYSTNVSEGDNVCISAEYGALPFIKEVSRVAIKKGAFVKYFVDIPEIEEGLLKNGNRNQISQPNFRFGECAKSDVWISAWGTNNVQSLKNIDTNNLKLRRIGNTKNRKIYNKRSALGELRWCGTQFPLNGDAQYASMSLDEYEDFVYSAGFLDKDDPVSEWRKLEKFQQKWIDYLDTKKELHIISKNTNIRVGIKGRKWINCCGKENFPDGEIFTSPEENNINGFITFSYAAIINGNEFEKVKLEVENGLIINVNCKNEEMKERLMSYIDTDEGSKRFGEVAIGTNYGIKKFTRNILFDEKIGGTIHMAIGAAMPEAGGVNESAIHWDMINDMTECGQICADGQCFYKNGRFIDEVLCNSF